MRLLHVPSTWRGGDTASVTRTLVADEMVELQSSAGVRHIDFVDSTFNSPPGHAIDGVGPSPAPAAASTWKP